MAIRPLENERELLIRASRGDQDAFAALFRGYHQPLGDFILRYTQSLQLAEDILQDVFIRVWLKRADLTGINNFSGWLFILARNQTINALEKQVTMLAREQGWTAEEQRLAIADEEGETGYFKRLLHRAVDRLPPQQQKAWRLHHSEGLTYAQVAEQLGIAPSTVKSNLEEAMKNIKRQLQGRIDPIIILILITPLIGQ